MYPKTTCQPASSSSMLSQRMSNPLIPSNDSKVSFHQQQEATFNFDQKGGTALMPNYQYLTKKEQTFLNFKVNNASKATLSDALSRGNFCQDTKRDQSSQASVLETSFELPTATDESLKTFQSEFNDSEVFSSEPSDSVDKVSKPKPTAVRGKRGQYKKANNYQQATISVQYENFVKFEKNSEQQAKARVIKLNEGLVHPRTAWNIVLRGGVEKGGRGRHSKNPQLDLKVAELSYLLLNRGEIDIGKNSIQINETSIRMCLKILDDKYELQKKDLSNKVKQIKNKIVKIKKGKAQKPNLKELYAEYREKIQYQMLNNPRKLKIVKP